MNEDFIAKRVSHLRIQKGVSARDMSLSLGQSESYINKIENQKTLPSVNGLFYICEYFEVSPAEFFDENNTMPSTLREVIADLKSLSGNQLKILSSLIKEIKR